MSSRLPKKIKCPVCGEKIFPLHVSILWGTTMGYSHQGKGCWWTEGAENSTPVKLSLWEKIKKHGLKAKIF